MLCFIILDVKKLPINVRIILAGRNSPQKRLDRGKAWQATSSYEWTIYSNKGSEWADKELFNDKATLLEYNVLVVSSDFEGWPLIIVEALQYGLYVLSTKSFGAINELIPNEIIGRVIPFDAESIDSYIEASMNYILSTKYQEMRRQHIASIVDGVDKHMEKLIELWR